MFLFGARDVWFVVALPVFLAAEFSWTHWQVGGFLASWIILYGLVQTIAPKFTKQADGSSAIIWAGILALIPAAILFGLASQISPVWVIVIGLLAFGFVFAVNSSLHSFLIVSYASRDSVSLDVGFYYMANAMGRLIGTVLSGWLYQVAGLPICLAVSSAMIAICFLLSFTLPKHNTPETLNHSG